MCEETFIELILPWQAGSDGEATLWVLKAFRSVKSVFGFHWRSETDVGRLVEVLLLRAVPFVSGSAIVKCSRWPWLQAFKHKSSSYERVKACSCSMGFPLYNTRRFCIRSHFHSVLLWRDLEKIDSSDEWMRAFYGLVVHDGPNPEVAGPTSWHGATNTPQISRTHPTNQRIPVSHNETVSLRDSIAWMLHHDWHWYCFRTAAVMPIHRPGTSQRGARFNGSHPSIKKVESPHLVSTKCRAESRWGCHAPFSADFVDASGVRGLSRWKRRFAGHHTKATSQCCASALGGSPFWRAGKGAEQRGVEHGKRWENMLDDWAVVDVVFEQMCVCVFFFCGLPVTVP